MVLVVVDARVYVDVAKVLGSLGRQLRALRRRLCTLVTSATLNALVAYGIECDEQTDRLIRHLSLHGERRRHYNTNTNLGVSVQWYVS